MAEILDKLFGSGARVKIMRFFLASPYDVFPPADAAKILRLPKAKVRREAKALLGMKFLRKSVKETEFISAGTKRLKKLREPGFALNNIFPYARELKALLVDASPISRELLQKRFRRLGKKVNLVLLAGFFVGGKDEGIDILVVGDNIQRSRVEKLIGKIEAEVGKELKYSLLSTEEFKYRQSMYDKFLRDILEGEHEKLINNLDVEH
ncbi:MAG: hypothetical protein Q8Q97_02555 [bacterium]|nr:hypothetical protein [bacterium]